MEILLKKALTIVLNEGGGAVSILLIVNILLILKASKRFTAIEKTVSGLKGMLKDEIADMELMLVKKYVEWSVFDELRKKVDETKNEVSKILGRMNGRKT